LVASAFPAGENPHPVRLVRPSAAPLSAMARLGRSLFFDARLSSSGRLSCASCHSPQHAYGPPTGTPVMDGGPHLMRQGSRAVPSLMYLERQPAFGIGHDTDEGTAQSAGTHLVPQGGLFWDGRADTLQQQARSPLLSPFEMDGGSLGRIAAMLRRDYAASFVQLFGAAVLKHENLLVGEALFAIGRYEIEDRSFHPYSSKYDAWLEGRARFTPAELRGYEVFNDAKRGNCAACHLDRPGPDGLPPLFTDHQYEALGVPRNRALTANRNPNYYDLGLCGPMRGDLRSHARYCGMFATPTLRNVATRHVFFHNGRYHSLREVLDFYDLRAVEPRKIYPNGMPDDLPTAYRRNIDRTPPFDRKAGGKPPLSAQDEKDLIAFLKTLTDGYAPVPRTAASTL
jgi:cytochrome c peroxidase